jgi:hypothetical protein
VRAFLTAATAALICASVVPASASAAASCQRKGEKVIASNSQSVVVAKKRKGSSYYGVFGCLRGSSTRLGLALDEKDIQEHLVGKPRLAGAYVLANVVTKTEGGTDYSLLMVGLSSGQQTAVTQDFGYTHKLYDSVIKDDGSFGWIQKRAGVGYEVSVCPRATCVGRDGIPRRTILDKGTGIKPRSLALSGSRLTWADGGTKKSATL